MNKKFLFSVIVALFILMCFPILLTWYTYRTEYCEGYISSEFRKIKSGDSVYIAFEKLGYPFYYSVTKNDNEGYNDGILTDSTDISKLTNWISSDSNVVITLQYSRPKYPDAQGSYNNGSFKFRGFKIHKGTIVQKLKFNYCD
ncbi:MAG: hypothetical protein PHO36_15075 [Parabacteroides sp.]|nr:hypothetical protein [Parabacteroides sp.]